MVEEDIDLIVHLGDYIYEGAARTGRPRYHNSPETSSLNDYRNRHALYRTDPDLQKAHQLFPWVVTWDDHELENNYANDKSEDGVLRDAFLERRANAYQAYYEHMPLRRASLPKGSSLLLYRRLTFGNLAEFAGTLKKGTYVQIEGELRSREYASKKTDSKQRIWEIRVNSILKLDRGEKAGSDDQDSGEEPAA